MPNENEREYKTLVTAVGKNKIAVAIQGGGKVNITQVAVGDGGGNYYTPSADMTALIGEVWRGDIAGRWINEQSSNMVDVKVILPADVGGFTVREAALFDEDGDMIAICNMPDTEKAVITTGAAGTLTIIMHIILADADAVKFTIDPHLDVVTAEDVERMINQHKDTALNISYDDTNAQSGSDNVQDAIDALFARKAAVTRELIIPSTGWDTGAEESSPEELHVDIAQEDITEEMIPIISILPGYTDAAGACGMSTTSRTIPGALRLYAKKAPTEEIHASLTLLTASCGSANAGSAGGGAYVLPVATATRLGGVKIGNGITVTADGTISSSAELPEEALATSVETAEMLDEVFPQNP